EIDLGAPSLLHVLAHRRALLRRGALAVLEALFVAGLHCAFIALAGARDRFRRQVKNLLELIALRLADADRFAAESGREAADRLALQHLAAGETRAGRKPVAHDVGNELRPALAPEVVSHLGAVGIADQPADFLRAVGDAAVHLPGAKHRVRRAA